MTELLPLSGAHQGRSRRTCELKCGSACFHPVPNRSDNDYIGDVIESTISRRSVLKGGLSLLVIGAAGGMSLVGSAAPAEAQVGRGPVVLGDSRTGLRFTPIPSTPANVDDLIVPEGYAWTVLARWGDPILPGAPAFDKANQTAAAQAGQFGYNCDYVAFYPLGPGRGPSASSRGLLGVNHEYTIAELMFDDYQPGNPTREQVDTELAAHGISVIEIARGRRATGPFVLVDGSRFNRRITATTPITLTGPAAGDDLLKTSEDPTGTVVLGTLNNCAGGKTPWGTYLSAEENFNQYFANNALVADPAIREAHARYGLPGGPSERRWEAYHDRFDLAKEPNEPFRFGWVVELDPSEPERAPVKRTALCRFTHKCATSALAADGRAVIYQGDDERFDYVYKFVSRERYIEGDKAHNLTLLDDGDLYVARFEGDSPQAQLERYNDPATLGQLPDDGEFDGVGTWVPLISGGQSDVPGFSIAEVLILTRQAADATGLATKMDRPEDCERNPVNGRVYLCMTNNTARGTGGNPGIDEANPRRVDESAAPTGNKYGHVVELEESGDDAGALTFQWRLFLVCGDPSDPTTYFAGFDPARVSPVAAPDNVAFDSGGNCWIATDGQPGTLGKADAFHAVPVEGPQRGAVRQFLSTPAGSEACGPEFTPDDRNLFCAVQHPGDQGLPSTFPDGDFPRPTVVSVFRERGNPRIGS
ncbi:MAG: PhoX family protein [Egibacteraceae bacterium]